MFFDPALVVLWGTAVGCIWYGAVRSHSFFHEVKATAPQEVKFVQSNKVIALPIVGSIVLLLLFYFLSFSITIWILVVIISLVILVSQFFVFSPLADYIFDRLLRNSNSKGFTLPKLGFIPYGGIALLLFCIGIVVGWLLTGHWTLVDESAWCIAVTQLCVLRLPSLKISTLLLVPFLIYDVFWVFLSPLFFHGQSVMVTVAMSLPPFPLLLKVPHFSDMNAFSGLGLGDIVLPGLFIVFLYSFDEHLKQRDQLTSNWSEFYLSYFTMALIEYTIGYALTILAGTIMNSGQPALLYLVPCTLGGTVLLAWRRGHLALMWKGHHAAAKEQPDDIEAQSLLLEEKEKEEDGREDGTIGESQDHAPDPPLPAPSDPSDSTTHD